MPVFARVVEGMDVVDAMKGVETRLKRYASGCT